MNKLYEKRLLIITCMSLSLSIVLGSEIPWHDLSLICFSWPLAKNILYDMSIGVFASTILVWAIDQIQLREQERENSKKRIILYNKLEPVLKKYYDFYLLLYKATRREKVKATDGVLTSLYSCYDEFVEQLKEEEPFYKPGNYVDSKKAKMQMTLMQQCNNDSGAIEQIMQMDIGIPWYACWEIEGKAFYDELSQIEKDYSTFFTNELLDLVDKLLLCVAPQINMTSFISGESILNFTGIKVDVPQLPTEFFVDAYNLKDVIHLLDEIMKCIEEDSGKNLRHREEMFFNGGSVAPSLGASCNK